LAMILLILLFSVSFTCTPFMRPAVPLHLERLLGEFPLGKAVPALPSRLPHMAAVHSSLVYTPPVHIVAPRKPFGLLCPFVVLLPTPSPSTLTTRVLP
jgi:hypothetical protein